MNEYGLLTIAYEEIKSFFENQLLSMDFSERSHNEMRNDLKSGGPGKSGELSGDRVFVKQMFAKHVAKGGEKPNATHTHPLMILPNAMYHLGQDWILTNLA